MRAQSLSLAAGCVLAAIAVAGCAILAFMRPQGALGDAPIVMARSSGALYVYIGETLHPVRISPLLVWLPGWPRIRKWSAMPRSTRPNAGPQ